MKILLIFIMGVCCSSCVHAPRAFVQDDLTINLPVRQKLASDGNIIEQAFNDGGTKMIQIIDSSGKVFDVYIDHRIGMENEWGTFYVNGYPGTRGSIRIIDAAEFKNNIGRLRY